MGTLHFLLSFARYFLSEVLYWYSRNFWLQKDTINTGVLLLSKDEWDSDSLQWFLPSLTDCLGSCTKKAEVQVHVPAETDSHIYSYTS